MDTLAQLKQYKPLLMEQYPAINYLGLFGSCLSGPLSQAHDIDILIDFDFSKGSLSLFDYFDIQQWLSQQFGKTVDLVDRSRLKRHIGQHILSTVQEA